jgi:hypothetical protein
MLVAFRADNFRQRNIRSKILAKSTNNTLSAGFSLTKTVIPLIRLGLCKQREVNPKPSAIKVVIFLRNCNRFVLRMLEFNVQKLSIIQQNVVFP